MIKTLAEISVSLMVGGHRLLKYENIVVALGYGLETICIQHFSCSSHHSLLRQ